MGDNVANSQREEASFPLTDVDKWVLSQTDEEFQKHDWEDLKQVIGMANHVPLHQANKNYSRALLILP